MNNYDDCPVCKDEKGYDCPVCDIRRIGEGIQKAGMDIRVAMQTCVMGMRLAFPGEPIMYSGPEEEEPEVH